nr:DUF1559 domain-containing protein [Paludisphaera mucosa]
MGLTRARESARLSMCQRNLAQVGQALAYYDGASRSLPPVAVPLRIDESMDKAPPGPLATMLEALGVPSLLGVDREGSNLPGLRGPTPQGIPVAGFLCPSDSEVMSGRFPSPVSYRANVGSDLGGSDGPFAVGRSYRLAEVERRDGLSFTAAFCERLVGNGRDERAPANYQVVDLTNSAAGDGAQVWTDGPWKGDAGSTWKPADFRYTLYNHVSPPWLPVSRVARDGRSADVTASSAHVQGLNLLMLDGSARVVTPSVAPEVWRAYGSVGPEPAQPPASSPLRN